MSGSDEAAAYIKTHCKNLGSYLGDFSPYRFLSRVAEEMTAAAHTELFPERYKEHVAYALRMVSRHEFLEPPAAIAAVYLATRFEFFFRLLSGKLKGNGTWVNPTIDQPLAIAELGKKGLKGKRISDVAVTYKLMKLNQSRPVARVFDVLDKAILPTPVMAVGSFEVRDIGDRIAFGRHSVGHGLWGDISSEAVFLRACYGDRVLQPKLTSTTGLWQRDRRPHRRDSDQSDRHLSTAGHLPLAVSEGCPGPHSHLPSRSTAGAAAGHLGQVASRIDRGDPIKLKYPANPVLHVECTHRPTCASPGAYGELDAGQVIGGVIGEGLRPALGLLERRAIVGGVAKQ